MNRDLTISFTSDIHGYFSNIDYAAGKSAATGLSCCAALFSQGENTLRIDSGDTLQGSPITYWHFQNPEKGAAIAAEAKERFSPEKIAAQLTAVYEEVISC